MGEFRVHHVRFFEYKPRAIHCLVYEKTFSRLAVSRSDGSIEVWSKGDNWYQEKVIPGSGDRSVEAMVWQGRRLFSAGLDGEVTEYDLLKLQPMHSAFSHAGPIWCLTQNVEGTRLAAGTEDGCVILFDTEQGNLQYLKAFDKQEGRILSIFWHEVENTIITGGVDNIRMWSVNSGHAVQRLTIGREEVAKETIIWCIEVTSDMTVISGDSRGKTCFWDGKMGTMIKSIQSHSGDVLSLCLNEREDAVFSVGVDPTIVQISKITSPDNRSNPKWMRSAVRSGHTHDIRTIVLADDVIVTGGVDTNLVFHNVNPDLPPRGLKVPGLPQRPLVSVATKAGMILLQYPTWLEVWRLGSTTSTSNIHGEILPLASKPLKLVQLKAKIGDCIVCSALSPDGMLLGYSDERSLRLYNLTVEERDTLQPSVSLSRIQCVADEEIMAAHLMAFTSLKQLVTATCTADVQVMEVTGTQVKVINTFQHVKGADSIHLLSVSENGELVAVADHHRKIRIYTIDTQQLVSLPEQHTQPSAMTFSADSQHLLVVCCDNSIQEYSVNTSKLSSWSRQNSGQMPSDWRNRKNITTHVSVNPRNPEQFFLHDDETFCILDKTKKVKSSHQTPDAALKFCTKYKYLLHVHPLSEDWLVVVEMTPGAITESLPPLLRQKKFGT